MMECCPLIQMDIREEVLMICQTILSSGRERFTVVCKVYFLFVKQSAKKEGNIPECKWGLAQVMRL